MKRLRLVVVAFFSYCAIWRNNTLKTKRRYPIFFWSTAISIIMTRKLVLWFKQFVLDFQLHLCNLSH